MDEWHDFLLAQAGAAGVLTGLVFVAVSINLQTIVSEPGSGLPGRAAEALILLVGVLTASVLLLVPGQGQVMVGAEVLGMGLATWGCVVTIQLLRLRSWAIMRPDLRQAFVLRVALAQIATLPSVVAGITVLVGGLEGLYWLVAGMVLSTLVALFEAWVLLVEINR
jgi:modulator of FtsH protease